MQKAPAKLTSEDGLPIPPYAVNNIFGDQPETLLDFLNILQDELVCADVQQESFIKNGRFK